MNSVRLNRSRYLNCGRWSNGKSEAYDSLLCGDWVLQVDYNSNKRPIYQARGGFRSGSMRGNADSALCRIRCIRMMVRSERNCRPEGQQYAKRTYAFRKRPHFT